MKIKVFDIFAIDATPEEFVELIKSFKRNGINDLSSFCRGIPDGKPKEKHEAVQVEIPLTDEEGIPIPGLIVKKSFRVMKPVDLMDRHGHVVKTYPSVTRAAKEGGFKDASRVSSAIRHKRTFGGYWYRYHKET